MVQFAPLAFSSLHSWSEQWIADLGTLLSEWSQINLDMPIDMKENNTMAPSTLTATDFGINTPSDTIDAPESLWSGPGAVPWPENTFQIIEKHTGRAITLVGDQPKLHSLSVTSHLDTHWLCVRQDGYFGFQNPQTGRYLGHDGKAGMRTQVSQLKAWELWTPRQHPDGGYELLSPYYSHTLMCLCVDEDGTTLVRRRHGTTLWEFVRV